MKNSTNNLKKKQVNHVKANSNSLTFAIVKSGELKAKV